MHGNVSSIGQTNADGMHKFIAASGCLSPGGQPSDSLTNLYFYSLPPPRTRTHTHTHLSEFIKIWNFLLLILFLKKNDGGIDWKTNKHWFESNIGEINVLSCNIHNSAIKKVNLRNHDKNYSNAFIPLLATLKKIYKK